MAKGRGWRKRRTDQRYTCVNCGRTANHRAVRPVFGAAEPGEKKPAPPKPYYAAAHRGRCIGGCLASAWAKRPTVTEQPEIPEAAVEALVRKRTFRVDDKYGVMQPEPNELAVERAEVRDDLGAALPAIHADLRERLIQAIVVDLRGQSEFHRARATMRGEGGRTDEGHAQVIEALIPRVRRAAESADEILAALENADRG